MRTLITSVDLNVPARVVYQQWTQFEEFPRLMRGVEEVRQTNRRVSHWKVTVAGIPREWDAEIREQTPGQSIAWHTIRGAHHSGTVTFKPLGLHCTRVTVLINYEPRGPLEKSAAALGVVDMSVEANLRQFKHTIEFQEMPHGAWHDELHHGTTVW